MTYLLVIWGFVMIYLISKVISDVLSKVVLYSFVGYWFVSLFICTFRPYEIYEVSNSTYYLLLLGATSFVAGMIVVGNRKAKTVNFPSFNDALLKLLNNRLIICVFIVSVFQGLRFAPMALAVAFFDEGVNQAEKADLIFSGDPFSILFYSYVMLAFFHLGVILVVFMIYEKQIMNHLFQFILIVVNCIAYGILAGSRNLFMIVLLYFIIVFFAITPRKIKEILSIKKVMIGALLFFGVMIGISKMTSFRMEGSFQSDLSIEEGYTEAIELTTRYSVLPLVLFERSLKEDYLDKFGYQYGRASFAGIDFWVEAILKRIGIQYHSSQEIVHYVQDNWVPYSPDKNANYSYTGLFYHYMDFGVIGVFMFPFMFGIIYRRIIIKYENYPNVPSLLLICICYFMTLHSLFTDYLIKLWIALYLPVLYLLHYRCIRKRKL